MGHKEILQISVTEKFPELEQSSQMMEEDVKEVSTEQDTLKQDLWKSNDERLFFKWATKIVLKDPLDHLL